MKIVNVKKVQGVLVKRACLAKKRSLRVKKILFLVPLLVFAAMSITFELRPQGRAIGIMAKCVKCGTGLEQGKCPKCTVK